MNTSQCVSVVKQGMLDFVRRELVPALEQVIHELPDALSQASAAEAHVRRRFLELAGSALQSWAAVADTRSARPSCPKCGVPMRHKGLERIRVTTTLGDIDFRRPRWNCAGCQQTSYPHDDQLLFLGHAVSWPLAKVVSRLGAQFAFGDGRDNLREDYGVRLAKQTLTDVTEAAGGHVLQQDDEERHAVVARTQPLPDSPLRPDKACVFADGTKMHAEGGWHEIRVATATAEDATGKPLARQSRARFLPVHDIAWVLALLARGVGYQHARLRAFVADGAPWLWNIARQYFSGAVQILDWYHLSEHVHRAANLLHREGSAEAKEWAEHLKDELWAGRVDAAVAFLKVEQRRVRAPTKRAELANLTGYLENNRERLDYPRYRALGLPIGSGQVEAQCKTLVGQRCKLSGMRNWKYAGAEGVLRMRAALHDGSFHDLWSQRLRRVA